MGVVGECKLLGGDLSVFVQDRRKEISESPFLDCLMHSLAFAVLSHPAVSGPTPILLTWVGEWEKDTHEMTALLAPDEEEADKK